MSKIKLDTPKDVELVMTAVGEAFAEDNSIAVGPKVIAQFAKALVVLAREVQSLRNAEDKNPHISE